MCQKKKNLNVPFFLGEPTTPEELILSQEQLIENQFRISPIEEEKDQWFRLKPLNQPLPPNRRILGIDCEMVSRKRIRPDLLFNFFFFSVKQKWLWN